MFVQIAFELGNKKCLNLLRHTYVFTVQVINKRLYSVFVFEKLLKDFDLIVGEACPVGSFP